MKKLMIAAAVAAMGIGAYASCDKPEDKEVNCAEVYDVVFNLKTTKCKCSNKKQVTIGDECGKPVKDYSYDCVAWREIVSKKVNGVIWSCVCSCSTDLDVESTLQVTPAWWDYTTVAADAQGNQYFWIAKDKYDLSDASLMTFTFLGRIGKDKKKVEAYGTFGTGISWAGFGTYDTKHDRVTKISGNAAGYWGAPYDCSSMDNVDGVISYTEDCPAYKLCGDDPAVMDDYSTTAAYGTFSVKYNAAKSKKLMAGKFVGNVIPAGYKSFKKGSEKPLNNTYLSK